MKIAIGYNLIDGPWGGANLFAKSLTNYLLSKGVQVLSDLKSPDLDVILLTEPRRNLGSGSFNDFDVRQYLRYINPEAIVVQRINDCDERRENHFLNPRIIWANSCVDHTVYIGEWLKPLFDAEGQLSPSWSVIRNGGDQTVFSPAQNKAIEKNQKLRLVTHHWGDSWLKGWDIYIALDKLLADPEWSSKFEFSYIGKRYKNYEFQNSFYYPPESGSKLADLLRRHDIYMSASQFEPAGMHHIEGALCGLPLIYRNSGALPEYCHRHGLGFSTWHEFKDCMIKMSDDYGTYRDKMQDYPWTAEKMCKDFFDLFESLVKKKEIVIKERAICKRECINDNFSWIEDLPEAITAWSGQLVQEGVAYFAENERSKVSQFFQASLSKMIIDLGFHCGNSSEKFTPLIPESIKREVYFLKKVHDESPITKWKKLIRSSGKREQVRFWKFIFRFADLSRAEKEILKLPFWDEFSVFSYVAPRPIEWFLRILDWKRQVAESVFLLHNWLISVKVHDTNNWGHTKRIVSTFLSNHACSKTGGYFHVNTSDYSNFCSVNANVLECLELLSLPIDYEDRLIDSVLDDCHESNGLELCSSIVILSKCVRSSNYRLDDVKEYCAFNLRLLKKHYSSEGGFISNIKSFSLNYRGVSIFEHTEQSDIVGTLACIKAIKQIREVLQSQDLV